MRFIDFIRDRARYYNCPVCGRSLRDCELRMLRHVEDRYTVQVTCSACQVQFIVILAVQGEGLEPIAQDELALDVDLTEEGEALEAARGEPEREPIQSDEVLDVHLLLKEYSGRLTDLFKLPSGDRR
ncbi:MAG: hypothetical protein M3170_08050 [Candidatus Dormibacteraeota bacterium]|jgi:hypothetical protein|nr:hypothetical protein [Candidatus Dormibacteraeota bacterium]MDQ6921534.1 hypothetical protein [Candidatus Dormibacteraeota bacterium]